MKRTLAAALLLGAVLVPAAPASANTGCRVVKDLSDPDTAYEACNVVVGLVPDVLCEKYDLCLA